MTHMTRPIGEVFDYKGIKLKVVESTRCTDCYFHDKGCGDSSIRGYCGKSCRTDGYYVSFIKIEENMFTKDGLKTGMIVEYNDGTRRLVLAANGAKYFVGSNYYASFESFNNNLVASFATVTKVFEGFRGSGCGAFETALESPGRLIWERPKEKVELTLEQIAEKFNIPVDSLRIKD